MKDDVARIAAMLGVLKANRIFIALAPNSPQKWIEQVLGDSDAAHIIVDKFTRSIAPSTVTVIEVDELAPSSVPFVSDRTGSADDTASIVYTSGSTGRPKGVANSHRRLLRASDVRYCVAARNPATGTRICAQVASPPGSATPYHHYFRGHACTRSIFITTVCRGSQPGSSPERSRTSRCRVRCCEHGLHQYPTIFDFQHFVSSGRLMSGSTQKTLLASVDTSTAIGASDIAIRRRSAALSRSRSSLLRDLPRLVLSRLAVRSMGWKSASKMRQASLLDRVRSAKSSFAVDISRAAIGTIRS